MKTIKDACELKPNALSIKLSDQVEQLDELISTEGDGKAFFEKTYITQGMQDLISEGLARSRCKRAERNFEIHSACCRKNWSGIQQSETAKRSFWGGSLPRNRHRERRAFILC